MIQHLVKSPLHNQTIMRLYTNWNFVQGGGSYSRNDPVLWLVYSDSTRRAAHGHIRETSQRVAAELGHFEVGHFGQKMTFFGYNVDFLVTGGRQSNF